MYIYVHTHLYIHTYIHTYTPLKRDKMPPRFSTALWFPDAKSVRPSLSLSLPRCALQDLFFSFISLYNSLMKIFFIGATATIVFWMVCASVCVCVCVGVCVCVCLSSLPVWHTFPNGRGSRCCLVGGSKKPESKEKKWLRSWGRIQLRAAIREAGTRGVRGGMEGGREQACGTDFFFK